MIVFKFLYLLNETSAFIYPQTFYSYDCFAVFSNSDFPDSFLWGGGVLGIEPQDPLNAARTAFWTILRSKIGRKKKSY